MKNKNPDYDGIVDYDFFNEERFAALEKGLIPSLETKLSFHLPNGQKGMLSVKFNFILRTDDKNLMKIGGVQSDHDQTSFFLNSFFRCIDAMNREFNKKAFILYGETISQKPKNLCVILIKNTIAAYSFKKEVEVINSKPHLN